MKKFLLIFFLCVVLFSSKICWAEQKKDFFSDKFPSQNKEEIFENLWFYDTLYSVDNPDFELKLRPSSISFKNTLTKKCHLLQNFDTRVVYRCLHGNLSYGDYYTYHIFVSAGPDNEGRCLVLGDTSLSPDKLNIGQNPVVYYFKSDDCGVYEDLTDYFIRF